MRHNPENTKDRGMNTINIEVDGRPVEAGAGETILSVLNRHGIHVPTLCHMEGLSPSGACRMCVVEVDAAPGLVPSLSLIHI